MMLLISRRNIMFKEMELRSNCIILKYWLEILFWFSKGWMSLVMLLLFNVMNCILMNLLWLEKH